MRFLEKKVIACECRGYQPTTKIGLGEVEESEG